jgi:Rieske Fe-S protein
LTPADKPHVPGPSLWPFVLAVGVALVLIGIVVDPKVVVTLGVVILVIALVGWARESGHAHTAAPELEPEQRAPAAPTTPAAATDEAETPDTYPRSVFLEGATLGLGGVIGGLITVPALGFALLPAFTKQHKIRADVGPIDNFTEGDWFITTFMTDPGVGEVSRQTAYIRRNADLNGNPSFTIISNHCAHLGCPVQPAGPHQDDKKKDVKTSAGDVSLIPTQPSGFSCPCHGGAYDTEGNRTAGPPVRSLDRFAFSIEHGHLFLEKPFSVGKVVIPKDPKTNKPEDPSKAEIWKYPQHNPGQPVSGIERFFYPIQPPR